MFSQLRAVAVIGAVLVTPALAQLPAAETMRHASGSFEVAVTPEAEAAAPAGGVPTSRMGMTKTFSGGLAGVAHGTMLAAGAPTPGSAASYVAIDQYDGMLDGRRGGFLLLHRGTIGRTGEMVLEVSIAPDSGQGALAGISGTLVIRIEGGKHFYDLSYRLPPR